MRRALGAVLACALLGLGGCGGGAPEAIQAEEPAGARTWSERTACIRTVAAAGEESRCLECHADVKKERTLSPDPTLKMVHALHLGSPLLRFRCAHCHRSVDLDEDSAAGLRRQVSAESVCLGCHGAFPPVHGASWKEMHEKQPKAGCMTCHPGKGRHRLPYLASEAIEGEGATGERCYGCHGGRALFAVAAASVARK